MGFGYSEDGLLLLFDAEGRPACCILISLTQVDLKFNIQ